MLIVIVTVGEVLHFDIASCLCSMCSFVFSAWLKVTKHYIDVT